MIASLPHHYRMFGLAVASEMPIPEALERAEAGDPDVVVRLNKLNLPPTPPGISAQAGSLVLTIPSVARYELRGGREIIVDPDPGIPERNVRLYLLGSAMGALLHQRGLLPLHANAVEVDGRAFAFIGQSGAGKSTLAGRFHDEGYRVLADDVCVVRQTEGGPPLVEPALRRLRLCRDALIASGRNPGDFEPSYFGDPAFDKFDVPLDGNAGATAVPLAAVILLTFAERNCLQPVSGIEAAELLFAHTYRGGIVDQLGTAHTFWEAVTRLLPAIDVLRWDRPPERDYEGAGLDKLVAMLRKLGADRTNEAFRSQVR